MSSAVFGFGAKDKKANQNYEILLGDEVEFVQLLSIPGTAEDKRCSDVSPAQTKILTSIEETKRSLPIYPFRNDLIQAINDYQILIIEGETGSGKTTQIPQYLYESGYADNRKIIGCMQPRRVAAMSVVARVIHKMAVKLGNEIGYAIRFEDCMSQRPHIKYMTNGTLHREFLSEPDLALYSVLIINEAHERTLHTDILFGLVKDITRFRTDFKLLICKKFSKSFERFAISLK